MTFDKEIHRTIVNQLLENTNGSNKPKNIIEMYEFIRAVQSATIADDTPSEPSPENSCPTSN